MIEYKFSTKKTACPCGHGKDFNPLTSHLTGGKCWANYCGQKFFPPETDAQPSRTYSQPPKPRPKRLPPAVLPGSPDGLPADLRRLLEQPRTAAPEMPQSVFDNLAAPDAGQYERAQLSNPAPPPEGNLAELLHFFDTVQVPRGTVSLPNGREIHNARMFAIQTVRALGEADVCPAALRPNMELLSALRGAMERVKVRV